jgi:CO/xanthine dehydrogenase FAD-binding subunit
MKVVFPNSFESAYQLSCKQNHVLFSGGTYILTENKLSQLILVDINKLLNSTTEKTLAQTKIGARTTLQEIIDFERIANPESKLIQSIKYSCPSKNLRNQRTIGGEVARNISNSEILAFLHAVNAQLTIVTDKHNQISIRKWDGVGIVKEIIFSNERANTVAIQRYSVIPSAPAIVIVAGTGNKESIEIAIGGKIDSILNFSLQQTDIDSIVTIANVASASFKADDYGTQAYKKSLITTAIKRIKETL